MKTVAAAIALIALLGAAQTNPKRIYQLKDYGVAPISVGKAKLKAWIADTDSKRQEGMMFLTDKEVPKDGAMLFVFPSAAERKFWMHNTLIPLDIAYIDEKFVVISVAAMKAKDDSGVPSKGAAMYVLEMKNGAFKRLGIKVGQKLVIPTNIKAQ